MNTVGIARDIDRVRAALDLRALSYTGTSYGSHVGEVYASLFPATSGRVLLNSVDAAGRGVDTSKGCVAAAVTRFLIQARPPRSETCPAVG